MLRNWVNYEFMAHIDPEFGNNENKVKQQSFRNLLLKIRRNVK